MKIFSRYILPVLFAGVLFSCRPSKICPAYHSYFILDTDVTRTTFSLFGADSLPRDPIDDLWQVDKKKVGIADDFTYKRKLRKQAIISMESVYLKKEDPFENQLAMAEMDSTMIDSLRHVQGQRVDDFYNYDQMIYLHYFGKYLPKPKEEGSIRDDLEPEEDAMITDDDPAVEGEQPEEKKGFFKKLFGKKKNKAKRVKDDEEEEDSEDPADNEEDDEL